MIFTKEMVIDALTTRMFATVVTYGETGLSSRTMCFAYFPDDKIFMLTHKGTSKLSDIYFSNKGLIHLGSIETDITKSFDISMSGYFQLLDYEDSLYKTGAEELGKKTPQVVEILNSDSRNNYELVLFHITKLRAWNYSQTVSGLPKTEVI